MVKANIAKALPLKFLLYIYIYTHTPTHTVKPLLYTTISNGHKIYLSAWKLLYKQKINYKTRK